MTIVWFHLKDREKAIKLELDEVNLAALDTPNVSIHGTSVWQDGSRHRVGFNTNNIESYDYQEEKDNQPLL